MASFVLIHGAWSGAFRWKDVRPLLWARGHDAHTPSLTGLGDRCHLGSIDVDLETHITDIVNLIEFEDLHDVVLVGASYGGMPITGAAGRVPERIAHLVYVDAFLPQDGDSCWSLGGGGQQPPEEGEWRVYPGVQVADQAGARRVPQPVRTLSSAVHLSKPTEEQPFTRTYIKAEADARPEPPRRSHFWEAADRVRSDPRWRYIGMDCGHAIPWTKPRELSEILLALPK